MRTIRSIKWTRWSVEHINRHNVTPAEVEEACFNEYDTPFVRSGKDGLHYVLRKLRQAGSCSLWSRPCNMEA